MSEGIRSWSCGETYQLDNKVQLHYVDFEGSDSMRSRSFLASAEPERVADWLRRETEDQSGDCRLQQLNTGAVQAGSRSRRAVDAGEDVKAPVLGTLGTDDAASREIVSTRRHEEPRKDGRTKDMCHSGNK